MRCFVPVGGGGLIAGVAAYIKHVRPEVKVIGVEPEDAPTLSAPWPPAARHAAAVGLFADGVAVKQIGKETFRVARETVDEVVLVTPTSSAPRSRTASTTPAASRSPPARWPSPG
jgi:threonine dehydratase